MYSAFRSENVFTFDAATVAAVGNLCICPKNLSGQSYVPHKRKNGSRVYLAPALKLPGQQSIRGQVAAAHFWNFSASTSKTFDATLVARIPQWIARCQINTTYFLGVDFNINLFNNLCSFLIHLYKNYAKKVFGHLH